MSAWREGLPSLFWLLAGCVIAYLACCLWVYQGPDWRGDADEWTLVVVCVGAAIVAGTRRNREVRIRLLVTSFAAFLLGLLFGQRATETGPHVPPSAWEPFQVAAHSGVPVMAILAIPVVGIPLAFLSKWIAAPPHWESSDRGGKDAP